MIFICTILLIALSHPAGVESTCQLTHPINYDFAPGSGDKYIAALSNNGRYLLGAIAQLNNTIFVSTFENGKLGLPRYYSIPESHWIEGITFAPNDRFVIIESQLSTLDLDDAIAVIPFLDGTLDSPSSSEYNQYAPIFSRDQKYVISATVFPPGITVFNFDTNGILTKKSFYQLPENNSIVSKAISPDGNQVAILQWPPFILFFTFEDGILSQEQKYYLPTIFPKYITFSPDSKHVLALGDYSVAFFNIENNELVNTCNYTLPNNAEGITGFTFSPTGLSITITGRENDIFVFSYDRNGSLYDGKYYFFGEKGGYNSQPYYSPDGKYLLFTNSDANFTVIEATGC